MKRINKLIPLGLIAILSACNNSGGGSTSPGWTYSGGSTQTDAYASYGTLGTPATTNIPGARVGATAWSDVDGNLWLFGGTGYTNNGESSGFLNDMWKYNPTNSTWTWISGSNTTNAVSIYGRPQTPSTSNTPGARFGSMSWRDADNNLWLYGGSGHAKTNIPGGLSDLWKFNPATNEWTWMKGPDIIDAKGTYGIKGVGNELNHPGSKLGGTSWTDHNGNLWLFGGADSITTLHNYNDLWKYNPTNNEWTWMSGESTANQPGIYGIQGQTKPTNHPGARVDVVSWVDSNGNLWLFGGDGIDGEGVRGVLNDLWKYDISTNHWTWMSGSNQANKYGSYGQQGVPTNNTIPGARHHRIPISWADRNGNFWLMGGDGYAQNTKGILNDVWTYNPDTNQWTWVSGSNESNAFGIYGAINSFGGTPGARLDATGWVDNSNNLWIFGGKGNAESNNGYLNDLWKYNGVMEESQIEEISYMTFPNYPGTTESNEVTTITGIRGVDGSPNNVYISGIFGADAKQGFIYTGPINGVGGTWNLFNYPSATGRTVLNTAFYGPNNGTQSGTISVVGNYTTVETGESVAYGLLYQGPLDGSGTWTTLSPTSPDDKPVINTIAHSNMGIIAVGNYDTQLKTGNAFIYNMQTQTYNTIVKQGAVSITAYGVWYNGGTSYTIVGGYSNANAAGLSIGYIADWDSATNTLSNWTDLNFDNQPITGIISHVEGITSDGNNGYNLAVDAQTINFRVGLMPSFANVHRLGHGFGAVKWVNIMYPGATIMSANTVYENYVLGIYGFSNNPSETVSYVAKVPQS